MQDLATGVYIHKITDDLSCKPISVSPVPINVVMHVDANDAQIQISTIDMVEVDNPSNAYHFPFDGNQTSVDVDVSQVTSGQYVVTVADQNNYSDSKVVVK